MDVRSSINTTQSPIFSVAEIGKIETKYMPRIRDTIEGYVFFGMHNPTDCFFW